MALAPCLFRVCRLSKTKKYTAYDRFHGNGPYGEIPTKKEPIRTLGFTLPYNNRGLLISGRTTNEPSLMVLALTSLLQLSDRASGLHVVTRRS